MTHEPLTAGVVDAAIEIERRADGQDLSPIAQAAEETP